MSAYDVVIVGAGPAGAGAAALLAEQGASVLLLDKESFPRYKACGGGLDGLAVRTLDEMGIDPGPLSESTPTELCVTSGGRYPAVYRFERPLALMTMRSDFDAMIARTAVERGAEFHDAELVKTFLDNGPTVTVTTSHGTYEARSLLGADGVYSRVARAFELNRDPILYVLIAAEVEAPEKAWAGRALIDISVWPLGYGWIFPKRTHLSIGIGVPHRSAKQLKPLFERFKQRTGLEDAKTLQQESHMLGFRRRMAPLAANRVLLVGDAAGLVDPNTGGGIGWALQSANLASQTVLSYLRGEACSLRGYTALIDKHMEPEFRAARVLRNSILLRFIVTRGHATRHKELWNEVVRVIWGEERYSQWYTSSKLAKCLAWSRIIPL